MLLLVAATFVATFLIVGVIGYLLLSRRNADPNGASRWHSEAGTASPRIGRRPEGVPGSDDVVEQVSLQEKMAHTIHWLRQITGADQAPANALPASAHRVPGLGVKVLLACVMLVLAVAIFLGTIAGMNQLFAWFVEPVIGFAFQWLFPLLLTLEGSLLVAAAVLVLGLPLARRFRQPERFRNGVIAVVLAIATLWPLQYAAGSVDLGFWEFTALLRALALFISVSLFAGGLEAMRRATNTPEHDSWEF